MATLPTDIEQMLSRLAENSDTELNLVRALAEGIRRVDERMLHEVRAVAMQHEMHREAIFVELQDLASRLCAMPARNVLPAIDKESYARVTATTLENSGAHAGDRREVPQKVCEELDVILNRDGMRH